MVRHRDRRRRVRRLRLIGIATLAAAVACGVRAAQQPAPKPGPIAVVRMGLLLPPVHEYLRSRWSLDPDQLERGYCASWHVRTSRDGAVFVVDGIRPAQVSGATQTSLRNMLCAEGSAPVHTHPPATCRDDAECEAGGPGAHQCFPSPIDVLMLERTRRYPFGIVQCGPDHFVFFQSLLQLARPDGTVVKPK